METKEKKKKEFHQDSAWKDIIEELLPEFNSWINIILDFGSLYYASAGALSISDRDLFVDSCHLRLYKIN